MPSPLHIGFVSLWETCKAQWDDRARNSNRSILTSQFGKIILSIGIPSLFLQILTGILLSFHYSPTSSPSTNERGELKHIFKSERVIIDAEGDTLALPGDMIDRVAKKGEYVPTTSYISVVNIEQSSVLKTLRTIHSFNTHVLICSLLSFMLYTLFLIRSMQYVKGLWLVLTLLGVLLYAQSWTGYVLPWDTYAATSHAIMQGIMRNGLGIDVNHSSDLIARMFSLHAIIFPVFLCLMLIVLKNICGYSFLNLDTSISYIFLIAIPLLGIACKDWVDVGPPADALKQMSYPVEPIWLFQPLHGIINAFPLDLALTMLFTMLFLAFYTPFISSFRLRITIISLIIVFMMTMGLYY